jgi:hypothetical protein
MKRNVSVVCVAVVRLIVATRSNGPNMPGSVASGTPYISNFRRVLNVACFLLGNSPAAEFYMPTFRNTLSHFHRQVDIPTCL